MHILIHNIADLYDIRVEQINGDGSREKSAQKVVKGIRDTVKVPFERVVFALGIRFIGETSAKLLARHFKSMEALANASIDELQQVEGIGEVMAKSIVAYFHNEENQRILDRLKAEGLQMALSDEQQQGLSNALAGKSIVISGVFTQHSRDEYKAIIEQHGGKNVGSISAKTSFILAGENMGPSKLQKAQKLNIPIVNEEEFIKMLSEPTDTSDSSENSDSSDYSESPEIPESSNTPESSGVSKTVNSSESANPIDSSGKSGPVQLSLFDEL